MNNDMTNMTKQELLAELQKLSQRLAPIPAKDSSLIKFELANLPTAEIEFEIWAVILCRATQQSDKLLQFTLNLLRTLKGNDYIADTILYMKDHQAKLSDEEFETHFESLPTLIKYLRLTEVAAAFVGRFKF